MEEKSERLGKIPALIEITRIYECKCQWQTVKKRVPEEPAAFHIKAFFYSRTVPPRFHRRKIYDIYLTRAPLQCDSLLTFEPGHSEPSTPENASSSLPNGQVRGGTCASSSTTKSFTRMWSTLGDTFPSIG